MEAYRKKCGMGYQIPYNRGRNIVFRTKYLCTNGAYGGLIWWHIDGPMVPNKSTGTRCLRIGLLRVSELSPSTSLAPVLVDHDQAMVSESEVNKNVYIHRPQEEALNMVKSKNT